MEILDRVQFAYQNLPKWLQQGVKVFNKGSFVLENNSKILARATSKSAIRGLSVNFLFIDEVAFVENWLEFYTSSSETISSGKETKIALVSTCNGLNHFWELWNGAVKGINNYNPIMVTWDMVPGRDKAWKEDALRRMNMDTQRFSQEHECQFLGSAGTLLSGYTLQRLTDQVQLPDEEKDNLRQFIKPQKGHVYCCVCDVSEGRGLDYSAFQMIDITSIPYKQAATFRDNYITPMDFAETIFRISTIYNEAAVLVETNNMGHQIAEAIHNDFEYENIIFTKTARQLDREASMGFSKVVEKGIRTTKSVKAVGCSILKLLIEQEKLEIYDSHTVYELSTFARKGKSFEAEEGKYDDLTMCLVLFAWLTDQRYFKELNEINTLQRLREKTAMQIENDLIPFGYIDDGTQTFEEVVNPNPTPEEVMAQVHDSDNDWLFRQE
jgi:hypothetical protein